jgi:hypothetical protein
LICPHWTTNARKTEEKMVGDCNKPLGLILEWKMMMILKLHLNHVYCKMKIQATLDYPGSDSLVLRINGGSPPLTMMSDKEFAPAMWTSVVCLWEQHVTLGVWHT